MIVEIFCISKCNWDCYYCCENIHNSKKNITEDIIKHKVIKNKNNKIILSGGEIGLLEPDLLYWIFNNHNHISVNTNGLFIEKYPDLVLRCKKIFYHCSKDLDFIEKIYNYENIEYLVIVTDDNIHKLESFLNKYKNIIFDVIPSDIPNSVDFYKNLTDKDNLLNIIRNKNVYNKSINFIKTGLRYKLKKFE